MKPEYYRYFKHYILSQVSGGTMDELIDSAEAIVEIDEITIYLDCHDNHHYFSDPSYGSGHIYKAELIIFTDGYKNIEMALHAYITDWIRWTYKQTRHHHNAAFLLSEMRIEERKIERREEADTQARRDDSIKQTIAAATERAIAKTLSSLARCVDGLEIKRAVNSTLSTLRDEATGEIFEAIKHMLIEMNYIDDKQRT